jgi:hypothetical protein
MDFYTPPSNIGLGQVGGGGYQGGSTSTGNATATGNPNRTPSINPKHVETLLAQELNSLSFAERQNISEEIHGVSSMAVEETIELLQESLVKFEREIHKQLPGLPGGGGNGNGSIGRGDYNYNYIAGGADGDGGGCPNMTEPAPQSPLSFGDGYRASLHVYTTQPLRRRRQPHTNMSLGYLQEPSVRIKFLRAELFDIPKAVRRFLKHIDFLYSNFGIDAMYRPLELDDLTKPERNLLQNGFMQLLPSRERGHGRMILAVLAGNVEPVQVERVCFIQ